MGEGVDPDASLNLLWTRFTSGLLSCPLVPNHFMALLVRETPIVYQFQCTRCSWHSSWFEVRNGTASATKNVVCEGPL